MHATGRPAHNLKVAGSNPAPATNPLPPFGASFQKHKDPRSPIPVYRVYVIRNLEGRFYIGMSEDVAIRVAQHNEGVSK